MKYSVRCGYRTDGGMLTSAPTHFDTVIVEAIDPTEARIKAIHVLYAKHQQPNLSHVQPGKPVELK